MTVSLPQRDDLADPLGEFALEYIGEYEHGSVDLDTLMPKHLKALYARDQALQLDLLEYAANVLQDFLGFYDTMKS